jgi:ABC-type branched-subunit amino acid transport system permease subunit
VYRKIALVAGIGVLLWLPQYAEGFFLQTGLFCIAAAIAAIGLTLLVGITGQLSLAHAFFIAVGAYGYCYLAADAPDPALAATQPSGLGLPPILAMIGATLLAGLAGARFSPIASCSTRATSRAASTAATPCRSRCSASPSPTPTRTTSRSSASPTASSSGSGTSA